MLRVSANSTCPLEELDLSRDHPRDEIRFRLHLSPDPREPGTPSRVRGGSGDRISRKRRCRKRGKAAVRTHSPRGFLFFLLPDARQTD